MNTKYIGSKILSELNDLKRTLESASKELDIELSILEKAVKGELPLNELNDLTNKITSFYPINKTEFDIEEINLEDRFIHFKASEALSTSRIYQRENSYSEKTDYYEYRDSATTRISKFRPEWIKVLRIVKNNNPRNKDVVYNNGHFMHQLTFFVGPVNFYYKIDDEYYCEEMNTGDSNYIPPFIPHSFTSRDSEKETYIIAITFGGNFKNILPRVSTLNNKMVEYINNLIKNRGNYVDAKDQINLLKDFKTKKIDNTNQNKSKQKDLGVIIKKKSDYELIKNGVFKAASSESFFSGARGFHIISNSSETIFLVNPCDSFLFNYGDQSIFLENITLNKKILLKKGDSSFITCGDEFKLVVNSSCGAFLVTLDLYLTPSIIDEIISFTDFERLYEETKQWFN